MPTTQQLTFGEIEVVESSGDVVTRHYGYLEPDQATSGPLPLVLVFHGGGGNMSVVFNQLAFGTLSPRSFLTVFLQGDGPELGSSPLPPGVPTDGMWNCGHLYQEGVLNQFRRDDVAFVDALLLEVTRRTATAGWRIDQSRTYAVGYSNGGMMAYRLAAERSSEFAAIAVIAGSIGGHPDPDDPTLDAHINHPATFDAEPVSVLHIHGLLDTSVPFQGGIGEQRVPADPRSDLTVADAIESWVSHNGCDARPEIDVYPDGLRRRWSDGRDGTEVQLLTSPSAGHEVPPGVFDLIEPFLLSHHK